MAKEKREDANGAVASQRGRTASGTAPLVPLNFKVPKEFRREFKTFASQRDMKMVELLQEGFRLAKERHGGSET